MSIISQQYLSFLAIYFIADFVDTSIAHIVPLSIDFVGLSVLGAHSRLIDDAAALAAAPGHAAVRDHAQPLPAEDRLGPAQDCGLRACRR